MDKRPRFVLFKVSAMAVTVYASFSMATTVKQIPLCATLWSILSSLVNGEVNVKWMKKS